VDINGFAIDDGFPGFAVPTDGKPFPPDPTVTV
jgi:hypothetical protein